MDTKLINGDKSEKKESAPVLTFTHRIRTLTRVSNSTVHGISRLGYIKSGNGQMRINDRIYDACFGFSAFLKSGDRIDIIPDGQIIVEMIEFSDMYICESMLLKLPQSGNAAFRMSENDAEKFAALFKLVESAGDMSDENRTDYQRGILRALIAWFLEVRYRSDHSCKFDENYSDEPRKRQSRGEKRLNVIRSAVIYTNQHFTEHLTMSDIARMYDTQDQYFCRKFHEITGLSFTEYVRNLRLHYAAELIKQTSHPIKEIYLECGYTTKSHFMREFKKYYSISPLGMRKAYIQEKIEQERENRSVKTGKKDW
ncbi:MAG: AraC family transcriptional regulator [Clostridiales bacterium]|nr:AraC family transcriptional regulator [Clostridiales bacterium]